MISGRNAWCVLTMVNRQQLAAFPSRRKTLCLPWLSSPSWESRNARRWARAVPSVIRTPTCSTKVMSTRSKCIAKLNMINFSYQITLSRCMCNCVCNIKFSSRWYLCSRKTAHMRPTRLTEVSPTSKRQNNKLQTNEQQKEKEATSL